MYAHFMGLRKKLVYYVVGITKIGQIHGEFGFDTNITNYTEL